MTLRDLVTSGLLATSLVAPVWADDGKAQVQVSVQVVRSCRVTTDQPQVSVNCGTVTQPVQVSAGEATPAEPTVTGQTAVAPASTATVTIHF